jgi:hypothetical protein
MKLAIATKEDFQFMWKIYRLSQMLEPRAYGYLEQRRQDRVVKVIAGRLADMGSEFPRVVMGCESLIDAVCIKESDIYELRPEIAHSNETLSALQALVKSLANNDEEGMIEHAEEMINARAAIAKATGVK